MSYVSVRILSTMPRCGFRAVAVLMDGCRSFHRVSDVYSRASVRSVCRSGQCRHRWDVIVHSVQCTNADSVLLAWALTCIIFLTLTVFTFQSKIDFSFMGGFLSCGAQRAPPVAIAHVPGSGANVTLPCRSSYPHPLGNRVGDSRLEDFVPFQVKSLPQRVPLAALRPEITHLLHVFLSS